MNYYERHLGDYARDAAHLTMIEHGAYTLLLDRIYISEAGIPADQAHRISRARTPEEIAAVDTVLAEFFTLADGVWMNGRAAEEIASVRVRIASKSANGKLGGRGHKRGSEPKATGKLNESEPKATALVSLSVPESEQKATDKLNESSPSSKLQAPASNEKSAAIVLPPWLPEKTWSDFKASRKANKKPMSPQAEERMLAKLAGFHERGIDIVAAIDNSIRAGWADVFEPRGQAPAPADSGKRRHKELQPPVRRA